MKYINEDAIAGLLSGDNHVSRKEYDDVLRKARRLQRLSLEEAALLLRVEDEEGISRILETASVVKDRIYGRRIVLFAPLYVTNRCCNGCLYCSFKADNPAVERKTLSILEIKEQVSWLLKRGHKRVLMVAAESEREDGDIDYYCEALRAVYGAREGANSIRRVNVNCAPLSIEGFRRLKAEGIGTYQLFQETYHHRTYERVHPFGPKHDPDYRITAIDRAFEAGIDDIGIGVLFGLYDWRFDALALLSHIEHLEKRFGIGPHTLSVPRVEPAAGAELSLHPPARVSDRDFRRLVAILRLCVPYTGIILSTREPPRMRDALFGLGVSQVSAESRTAPGGYEGIPDGGGTATQFDIADHRSLDEVIGSLLRRGFIPSFCAACYRKERTGEAFMDLARPGAIKNTCNLNALITLKEYLDDFASDEVKHDGYRLIERISATLNERERAALSRFFGEIDKGIRDQYL